jgi:DNA invertase Pin-like site-specific DNA recombinase
LTYQRLPARGDGQHHPAGRLAGVRGTPGIARAKAEGRYKGRKPTARAKAEEVRRLHGQGLRPTEIARRLGIGRASAYRVLKEAGVLRAGLQIEHQ